MGEVSWIKIKVDMFDDEKIKLLQALPEGDAIMIVWIRLLLLAGKSNTNGYLFINENLPYTDEMLSTIFGETLSLVRLALNAFENYGMIERHEGAIFLVNFEKHQNLDKLLDIKEYNRIKQREHREKVKLSMNTSRKCHDNGQLDVIDKSLTGQPCQDAEKESEEDIDKESYISSSNEEDSQTAKEKSDRYDWDVIKNAYNNICKDLPKIKAITDVRKKKVKSLMNSFDKAKIMPSTSVYQRLEYLFTLADESDFLSGRKTPNLWNGFDWLINSANAIKVIEGNYKNSSNGDNVLNTKSNSTNRFNDFLQRNYTTRELADIEKKLISKAMPE